MMHTNRKSMRFGALLAPYCPVGPILVRSCPQPELLPLLFQAENNPVPVRLRNQAGFIFLSRITYKGHNGVFLMVCGK